MSDEKKPLSETAFDRKMDERIRAIQEAQAKRDAEQDAKLARKSRMQGAITTAEDFDFTKRYPVPSSIAGITGIVAAFVYLKQGVPLYLALGISVLFVPGLAVKAVRFATGLKKAKGE